MLESTLARCVEAQRDQSSTRALPFDWYLIAAPAQVLGEVTEGIETGACLAAVKQNQHELKHLNWNV
jgi:hypothetical protein